MSTLSDMTSPGSSLNDFIASELRAALARRRLTGRRLALALGESHTWVSRRLSCQVELSTTDIERICGVLQISVASLLGMPTGSVTEPALVCVPASPGSRGDSLATGTDTERYQSASPDRGGKLSLVGASATRYRYVSGRYGSSAVEGERVGTSVIPMGAACGGNCANSA